MKLFLLLWCILLFSLNLHAYDDKKELITNILGLARTQDKVKIENFSYPDIIKIFSVLKNNVQISLKLPQGPLIKIQHYVIRSSNDVGKLIATFKQIKNQKRLASLRISINSVEEFQEILKFSHLFYALQIENINADINIQEIFEGLSNSKLNQLKILNLGGLSLIDEDIYQLFQSPLRSSLQILILTDNQLTAESAQILSEQASLRSLKYLHLGSTGKFNENHLENEGVEVLLTSPTFKMLEHLNLSRNNLNSDFISLLSESILTKLETLNISGNSFDDADIQHLGQMNILKNLKTLFLMDEDNKSGSKEAIHYGANAFKNWDKLRKLQHINYEFNDEEIEVIASQSCFGKLKGLKGTFSQKGINSIARSTYLNKLEDLNIHLPIDSDEHISGDGAIEIISSDNNFEKLKTLSFINGSLTDRALTAIARSKFLKNLQYLNLAKNLFTDKGLIETASNGNFPQLIYLNVQGNNSTFSSQAARALSSSKAFPKLKHACIKFKSFDQTEIQRLGNNFSKIFKQCKN